jgi:hypothetical protein
MLRLEDLITLAGGPMGTGSLVTESSGLSTTVGATWDSSAAGATWGSSVKTTAATAATSRPSPTSSQAAAETIQM